MRGSRVTVSIASVVLAAAVLGAGWTLSRSPLRQAPLQQALSVLPADTGAINFTRWDDRSGSVDDLGLAGRTDRSLLAEIDPEVQQRLGWSVRDLAWEVFAQVGAGGVTVLALGPDLSVRTVERSFAAIGSSDGDHTWSIDEGDTTFRSVFSRVRVLPDQGLVIAGADTATVDTAVRVARGDGASLASVRAASGVAEQLTGADSALLTDRAITCAASSLADQDASVGRQLTAALGDAPSLTAPAWAGRALTDGDPQRMRFAVAFGSDTQARRQLQAREQLVSGPFIGRSGRVQDSLVDPRVSLQGQVVAFCFALTPDAESFMTDTGPVAFAGCGA